MLKLFDAHFHIVDKGFPLWANNAYLPPEFTVANYLERIKGLNIKGGAVISGSFQGYDQSYLIAALKALGPTYVGVTQLTHLVSDEEIIQLNEYGVRGIRFNLVRGGAQQIKHLKNMAFRVFELVGWHIELYVESRLLADIFELIVELPRVSIDHLGLTKNGFKMLLLLLERGVKIKASGFGRVDLNIASALKVISEIDAEALIFGTDLPSTRASRAFKDDDIRLIIDTVGIDVAHQVLYTNAINFYKPKQVG